MDVMKFREGERGRNGDNLNNEASTFVCKETGDHVHYPPRRRARSPRSHHALPWVFSSSSDLDFGPPPTVRYRECRKNQAAEFGRTAYDGCGEFVAAAADVMKCAACGCHRSFHRRDPADGSIHHNNGGLGSSLWTQILDYSSRSGDGQGQIKKGRKESSSEDRKAKERSGGEGGAEVATGTGKRFRSKFTAEQKERMKKYADKLGWKMRNESSSEAVNKFCEEIGVKREIFRIWMNNHKNRKILNKG